MPNTRTTATTNNNNQEPDAMTQTATQTQTRTKKAKPETALFKVEFTDTYGGEANFCWIERYLIRATDTKQAVTKAKKARYHSPIPRHTYHYGDGDSARIDIVGAAVCAFVDWIDDTEADEYRKQYGESRTAPITEIE
jgi:hypothetical protein